MKFFILLAMLSVNGCAITHFERQKQALEEDVDILKLRVRKASLEHRLEHLESGKCGSYCNEAQ